MIKMTIKNIYRVIARDWPMFVCLNIHSFRSLPSTATASSPHSAIYCFLFQFTVYSSFLKVIRWLLTSSSSSPRHFSTLTQ